MVKIELYKQIAHLIEDKLGANHISTILHIIEEEIQDSEIKDLPQFVVVVKKFDKYTLMMITNIIQEFRNEIEIPYLVEYNDVQGMLDSVPNSFLKIKMNYEVLAGEDITEMMKPPSYEHFRAQMELSLRNDILNLRRDLIRVMSQQMDVQELLKELSIVVLNGIRNYYLIIAPELRTTEELIKRFNDEFPSGKEALKKILEYTYQSIKGIEIKEEDKLQQILSTFDNVLQPLLIEIDALGIEFEKTISMDLQKMPYEKFMETYKTEISELQNSMYVEFEQNARKNEHVVRGELELKYRKREKEIIKKFEQENNTLKTYYDDKINNINISFNKELANRTEDYIKEKLAAQAIDLENQYGEKIKKTRDELEFKFLTTDLQDKEEKLRKEYNLYEKKLRENFTRFERELRRELEIKEKNFNDSLKYEFEGKLRDEKDIIRKELEEEYEESLQRKLRNQQLRLETEMKRRENALEKTLQNEFKRREKDSFKKFDRDLKTKEQDVKMKLMLEFEREKGKRESQKSDELLKLIEKEMVLRYKELEKVELDLLKVVQGDRFSTEMPKIKNEPMITRNFMQPPESSDDLEENNLFSKILRDNLSISQGMNKKGPKKVS